MAGIVSRIFEPLDWVPAPLAFANAAIAGVVEAFILLRYDFGASARWYVRAAPFAAIVFITTLGLLFVVFSRPVVVRRETGTFFGRMGQYSGHFVRIFTLNAVIALICVGPVLFYLETQKKLSPSSVSVSTDKPKPVASVVAPLDSTIRPDEPTPPASADTATPAPASSESFATPTSPAAPARAPAADDP
ncbi:MAG TPA: hypothetical protein PK156_06705 [Polyangium sp.]|nr:hypothetical protein [Polyangium sp.]